MRTKTRTILIATILVATCILTLLEYARREGTSSLTRFNALLRWPYASSRRATLGVFSAIYVVSLPRRTDRKADMEILRKTLALEWTYVNATDSASDAVRNILAQVRTHREHGSLQLTGKATPFVWPNDLDELVGSQAPLYRAGGDFWSLPVASPPKDAMAYESSSAALEPLTCAEHDDDVKPYAADLPPRMILTASKVACWHSHIEVIRHIAEEPTSVTGRTDDIALILEDDVDMETDIRERLASIWGALPVQWDILFLGHCWSDQAHLPPIPNSADTIRTAKPGSMSPERNTTRLHPSFKPKCSHAYALTRSGARRLWLHLRHPPFAYSRAIDQAFAWLVESGRVTSFSVVPAVVVQRKTTTSDVMDGLGSAWREGLVHGVFDSPSRSMPAAW